MLKSKELRVKAWESLKGGKYWPAFLATIITGIIISGGAYFTTLASEMFGIPVTVADVQLTSTEELGLWVIIGMASTVGVIGLILTMLLSGPALIGCCGYFVKNTYTKPEISEVMSGFKTKYGRNVLTSLLIEIKIYLWTLLFIIPGIIKSFEYAIIPYILADDPEISMGDAFKKAKEMMRGNKWRLFKLNFSFIGWTLLCIPTLGIGAFFLVPYIDAANAEFYMELKNK